MSTATGTAGAPPRRLVVAGVDLSPLDPSRRVPRGTYPAEDFPEFPARVLHAHLVAKGLEWSVLGLAAAPALAAARGTPWRASVLGAAAAGLAATYGLTAALAAQGKLTAEGVDDRAYRILKNAGQARVDRLALGGAALGAAAGAVVFGAGLYGVAAHAALGCALGVAARGAELGAAEARARGYLQ